MRRLVIDLDGTITRDDPGRDHAGKEPDPEAVARLRESRAQGFAIVLHAARSMRADGSAAGPIGAHALPAVADRPRRHDIPCDGIHPGTPRCGTEGFRVDDRAVRPDAFPNPGLPGSRALIGGAAGG
ncbi:capsular biosynthesis protein [Roseomonas sp. NAR14]|uniref:Capsular biosynthesis protein n=1 Tax=Roseomonas acroporae TaxID=2937791 RepID=A0A9X2BWR4_9PROT|nr:capsular biosynthesis protein [Roseomonas acroporae]MCK8786371.1 capsular biosynthesis protein [Roseomonas acroporae]